MACLMERLGENMVDRQEDSYVERILIAMHMSFTCPTLPLARLRT